MIEVMKINGESFWVNSDLVRSVESTPDTLLIFLDGQRLLVKERPEEIKQKIIDYKRSFIRAEL